MKIILLAATTLDGKLARNAAHFVDWTSQEDKRLFYRATRQAGALIIGHNTFKTFPEPLPGRLHVVLTRRAEDHAGAGTPGIVEFTGAAPGEVVSMLEARGYKEAVLGGGSQINTLFLEAGLVDEIWLTIEPLVFGMGIDLFTGTQFNLRARLIHVEQLNEEGSLHLRYSLRP